MAFTLLQTKTSSKTASAGTTSTVALATTTTGSLLVAVVNTDKGSTLGGVTGISCAGASWAAVPSSESVEGGGAIADVGLWYAWNITGNTTPTLTVTYAAGMIGGAIIREYSGADISASPLDKNVVAKSGTSNNALSSGATPTLVGTNDLVIGYGGTGDSGNTYTAGSGYANATTLKIGTTVDMGMEDKSLSGSTAAQTATFTITNVSDWVCGVATFKALAAGAITAHNLTMLGVGV